MGTRHAGPVSDAHRGWPHRGDPFRDRLTDSGTRTRPVSSAATRRECRSARQEGQRWLCKPVGRRFESLVGSGLRLQQEPSSCLWNRMVTADLVDARVVFEPDVPWRQCAGRLPQPAAIQGRRADAITPRSRSVGLGRSRSWRMIRSHRPSAAGPWSTPSDSRDQRRRAWGLSGSSSIRSRTISAPNQPVVGRE
jgi:hypothetical protein